MDMETKQRLEREANDRAQTAAVLEHWKRKADRRRSLAFWLSPWQVVDDPVAAVPASEGPFPMLPSGADTGAAGLRGVTSTPTHALNPLTSGSRLSGGPTLHCSEASRISAATNRHT